MSMALSTHDIGLLKDFLLLERHPDKKRKDGILLAFERSFFPPRDMFHEQYCYDSYDQTVSKEHP